MPAWPSGVLNIELRTGRDGCPQPSLVEKTLRLAKRLVYSSQISWEMTPLAATSHASMRTQRLPERSSVSERVCFPKGLVPER